MDINSKITNIRISLESSIAHNISHNLLFDNNFDVNNYLEQCEELFRSLGMEEYLIKEIIDEGREQGIIEYSTGIFPKNIESASQIIPKSNHRLIMLTTSLVQLLKELPTNT
jgi:hypothetical protein